MGAGSQRPRLMGTGARRPPENAGRFRGRARSTRRPEGGAQLRHTARKGDRHTGPSRGVAARKGSVPQASGDRKLTSKSKF